MHRRLLNSDYFSPFSNIIFNFQGTKFSTFRALIEVRCPQLIEFEGIIKKRKEKIVSNGTILIIMVKEDCFLTLPVLTQLLDYLYSDNVDFQKLGIDLILKVQKAADFIGINRLVWLCERFLYSTLGFHNVYEVLKFADQIQVASVKSFCVAFAQKNWMEFSANKKGLEVLGLDLFQEITVTLHTFNQNANQTIANSYLDHAAPVSTLYTDLKNLHKRMEFTDSIVEFSDAVTLPFHRCFFAAHEPKFAQLFLEKKDSHKPFKFPISPESFLYLQEFIYYGSCNITPPCACEMIEEMVEKYSLEKFREKCEETLRKEITDDIVLRSLRLTYLPWNKTRPKLIHLRKECLDFIASHFVDIDIPSIRSIQPCGLAIAYDILDILHSQKRSGKGRRISYLPKQTPKSALKSSHS